MLTRRLRRRRRQSVPPQIRLRPPAAPVQQKPKPNSKINIQRSTLKTSFVTYTSSAATMAKSPQNETTAIPVKPKPVMVDMAINTDPDPAVDLIVAAKSASNAMQNNETVTQTTTQTTTQHPQLEPLPLKPPSHHRRPSTYQRRLIDKYLSESELQPHFDDDDDKDVQIVDRRKSLVLTASLLNKITAIPSHPIDQLVQTID